MDSHAVVGGVIVVVVIVACCMCSEVPGELRSTTEGVSFE